MKLMQQYPGEYRGALAVVLISGVALNGALVARQGMAQQPETQPKEQLKAPLQTPGAQPASNFVSAKVTVYFSPKGGATDAIIRELDSAKKWIRIQAYSFTSEPIAAAIIRAHRRGVNVKAVLDKSNKTAQYSAATFLQNQGAEVLIDDRHAIAHSKVIVIDGETLITGSFNFSKAAEEKNAENLLVIKDSPALLNSYAANFQEHEAHSTPYKR